MQHHENILSPQQSYRICTQISNCVRKGEREVTKKSILSFKTLQTNPSEPEHADVCTYKTKSHAKQILCNSYKRVQSEPLWKCYNRRVITSFQQGDCEDVFIHCLVLPKSKRIPKDNSNRFKEFFFQTKSAPAPRQLHL